MRKSRRACVGDQMAVSLTDPSRPVKGSTPTMKVSYFEDMDTLYVEFRAGDVVETRDLDENTVLDMDAGGHICAMTFEHASQRTDVKQLVVEGIAA